MSLKEKILSDMKEAMKNKDELRLRVLRSIKTAIGYFEVEGEKREATDEDIQKIILKEIKKKARIYRSIQASWKRRSCQC